MLPCFSLFVFVLLLLLCATTGTTAFVVSSSARARVSIHNNNNNKSSSTATSPTALGPIARNGLAYEDVTIGQGRRVLPGDTVSVYYEGTFRKDNTGAGMMFGQTNAENITFDAAKPDEGPPAKFLVGKNQLIVGCDLGIMGDVNLEIPPMNIGGQRTLRIPAPLAYGKEGAGPIPPNANLEFNIEVVNAEQVSDLTVGYKLKATGVVAVVVVTILSAAWFILHHL